MTIPIEIIVVVITVFFGSIGILIGVMIDAFRKNTDAFKEMGDAIKEIQLWMTKKDTSDGYEVKECEKIHSGINNRFDKNEKKIENHEHRISKLEK